MGLKRCTEKIKNIQPNQIIHKTYSKVTKYWDLKADKQKRKHKETLHQMLNSPETKVSDIKSFLASIGCVIGEIPILKAEVEYPDPPLEFKMHNATKADLQNKDNDLLQKTVVFKDKHFIADKTYNYFHKHIAPNIPSMFMVRKERLRQNATYCSKYRNEYGNYVDAKASISHQIKKNFDKLVIIDNTIQVKLCGDSTCIGKQIKTLNFCFTLPDAGLSAQTAFGNYTLGIFKIKKEDHETLRDCLSELNQKLTEFARNNEITVNERVYKIKFLLSGDLKFLHECMGLNACNAKHCCLICKSVKEDFFLNNIEAQNELKRSTGDQADKLNQVKRNYLNVPSEGIEGYLNRPIFSFISFSDVIFDTLHLSLRLPEKLIKLVWKKLITLDNFSESKNMDDLPHQKRFFVALEDIGVKNPFSFEKNEDTREMKLKMRGFNGDESLAIMEKLDFEKYFPADIYPQFEESKKLTQLFRKFYDIFANVKQKSYINNTEQCEKDTREWLDTFLNVFNAKQVTPYAHLFVGHLADFIRIFGDVDIYNIQGLEKLNDFTTQQYYRGSNKKTASTYQMLCHRIRLEYNKSEEKVIIKKPAEKRFLTKNIKLAILDKESNQAWIQFVVNGHVIRNTDLNKLGNPQFSLNTIEAALSVLKTVDTLVLKTHTLNSILGDNVNFIANIDINNYKFISGLITHNDELYLLFINMERKFFYFINPYNSRDSNGNAVFETWM